MSKAARTTTKASLTATPVKQDSAAGAESGRELMQAVLAKPRKPAAAESAGITHISGIVIGSLAGCSQDGRPMVYYPGIPTGKPLEAIATNNLGDQKPGVEVALGFVDGNPVLPIVLGIIQTTGLPDPSAPPEIAQDQSVNVQIDGERLTLSADREIVLQCGKSSITLTRAGKVILKGAYLSTHATGVNRIKGGSVQIN